jgi:hypothetical protein
VVVAEAGDMTWRAVLGWWIAAIVLVAILVGWERLRPAAGAGARSTVRAVFTDAIPGGSSVTPLRDAAAWPTGDAGEVRIERDGDPVLRFTRTDDGGWTQVEPVSFPVDPFSMERTIALMRTLTARDVLDPDDPDATPALLGFAPPAARVTLQWPDGETVAMELGRRGIGGRAYARVAGDPRVLVIDAELHERAVTADPREWRERSIFGDVTVDTASAVSLQIGRQRIELARDGRRWRMSEPYRTRVNPVLLDELIGRVATAAVAGFVLDRPDDLGRFGLAPSPEADLRVTVQTPGQAERTVRLRIGATAGANTLDRYGLIDDRPVVVRVPGALIQAIARRPAEWAEPTATGVRPADVGRMRLLRTDPATEIVLDRDGEQWTIAVGAGGAAPGEPRPLTGAGAVRLLDLMADVRAPGVRSGSLAANASTAVVLEDFSGRPLHTVRIARDATGEFWLMDAGDGLLREYPGGIEPPLDVAALEQPRLGG